MKPVHWKLLVVIAVIAWAAFYAWPKGDHDFVNLNLGLDLKGGSHLLMRVVTDDAVKAESDVIATRIAELLRTEGFPNARGEASEETPSQIIFSGLPGERLEEARARVEDELPSGWSVTTPEGVVRARMPSQQVAAVRDQAVRQVLNTIRNRIDQFGVAEPMLQRVGGANADRILLQLPGVGDPSRVKSVIQTQARLEFRMAYYDEQGQGPWQALTREDLRAQFGGTLPPGTEILPVLERVEETGEKIPGSFMLVNKTAVVTGSDLTDARPEKDQYQRDVVGFRLKVDAGSRFARHTRNNTGLIMPIVLDEKIEVAPRIESEISTRGSITGQYTFQEAEDLALVLRAGALPARVVTIEERTVGPSLGLDSIKAGVSAAAFGFALVIIFMVVYYKLSGMNAALALILNLLIVAGVMASIGATLTLPGIGGFILTVGMAVDANVLIFERIREELAAGRTVRASLEGGFGKALSAILDANVTTLIAALMLFQYGTGPVRGFAVVLSIGIFASLFTAIFVSRTVFELVLGDRAVEKLSI